MNDRVIRCDVAVVGGGPTGLGAATHLKSLGVGYVAVLEREVAAGGIPRHCGHPPFGMREFRRILTGPDYAARLRAAAEAAGVDIRPHTTVTAIERGPELRVSTPDGLARIMPRRVLLATGVRETPRSARLVSGSRPMGVLTTGALQSMVYLKSRTPFARPVIVGTELVSFSALLTCRHAGIRPMAMVEERSRPTAWRAATLLPRLQGVRMLMDTELARIEGTDRISGVVLRHGSGREERLACDGVVFSGRFTSESALARMGHIEVDPASGGPVTDQFGRCSDPAYFAAGNMVHPADSAGRCWQEGVATAEQIAHSLDGGLPAPDTATTVRPADPLIRYAVPQRLVPDSRLKAEIPVRVRFAGEARGTLLLGDGESGVLSQHTRALPERQVILRVPQRMLCPDMDTLSLGFREG
ncbi:MAG: NAD(P)/FAD-dependent oxidoreductase [Gammaproteobacteria bacterium]|nr:NAD(P)/FAD-dependent oxidoreductase [Gammaproteobacteria bacterium]MYG67196.1 NAD(P)/FAD-dependent oxidoreductase [Gammaproteobacteria bacterium]